MPRSVNTFARDRGFSGPAPTRPVDAPRPWCLQARQVRTQPGGRGRDRAPRQASPGGEATRHAPVLVGSRCSVAGPGPPPERAGAALSAAEGRSGAFEGPSHHHRQHAAVDGLALLLDGAAGGLQCRGKLYAGRSRCLGSRGSVGVDSPGRLAEVAQKPRQAAQIDPFEVGILRPLKQPPADPTARQAVRLGALVERIEALAQHLPQHPEISAVLHCGPLLME